MANDLVEPNQNRMSLANAAKLNPAAATFFAGVVILIGVVGTLGTQQFGLRAFVASAAVLIWFGILIGILTRRRAVKHAGLPAQTLEWFTVLATMLIVVSLMTSIAVGWPRPLPCYDSFSSEECEVARGYFEKQLKKEVPDPPTATLAAPKAIDPVIAEVRPVAPPVAPRVLPPQFTNIPVYIQFAVFPRPKIVAFASTLKQSGWAMQGSDRGGERRDEATGESEVRFQEADREAAQALAQQINAEKLLPKEVTLATTKLVSEGTLELWISP